MTGSYFNATVATGDHFACSFPIPFLAIAVKRILCPKEMY